MKPGIRKDAAKSHRPGDWDAFPVGQPTSTTLVSPAFEAAHRIPDGQRP
jgi:hypothetical protein